MGTTEFREEYVSNKVSKWVEDVKNLALIAKSEPQNAYAVFTKAIAHRWTYVQRTIPEIGHLFAPLEAAIYDHLIPALVGRAITPQERKMVALPVRYGGLGIHNPVLRVIGNTAIPSRSHCPLLSLY